MKLPAFSQVRSQFCVGSVVIGKNADRAVFHQAPFVAGVGKEIAVALTLFKSELPRQNLRQHTKMLLHDSQLRKYQSLVLVTVRDLFYCFVDSLKNTLQAFELAHIVIDVYGQRLFILGVLFAEFGSQIVLAFH